MNGSSATEGSIPVLLLKTRSIPHDGYDDYFAVSQHTRTYDATFVPVLEHKLHDENLQKFSELLHARLAFVDDDGASKQYGGLIFTSQRAVEAFAKVVEEGKPGHDLSHGDRPSMAWPYLSRIPIYTVGPATTRALRSIETEPPLQIFGEDTGNGESLAKYMQKHYPEYHGHLTENPPVLFLVGEQRRDIIPKTLMDPSLPQKQHIDVTELVVYGTGEMTSFAGQFGAMLERTEEMLTRWVVVFSPTGCEAMLRSLDMLDLETGRVKTGERGGGCGSRKGKRSTYIATIGPTTRDYLRRTFGFEPDVCAEKPSPEGIGDAISTFMDILVG